MGIRLFIFLIFCHILFATAIPKISDYIKSLENNNFDIFPLRHKKSQIDKPVFPVHRRKTNDGRKAAEEPISTEKTTTKDTDNVTEPNITRQCPEGQSSLTEKDLNDLITYFAKANNLVQTINESYFEHAILVRDKHLKTINDFRTRFQNKPTHLQHILDEMTQKRIEQIDPLVKQVTSKLPEISSLEIKYRETVDNSNIQMEKFEKLKKICALNCDVTEFKLRRKRNLSDKSPLSHPVIGAPRGGEEIHYCTTLKEVKDKINEILSRFLTEYIETLRNTLDEVDRNNEENVEKLKSDMKTAAVQEFGTTMYDVLSLEDEYYHFSDLLKNNISEFESQMNQVRNNNLQIDFKTEELKNYLEKYRNHCLSCNSGQRRYRRDDNQEYLFPRIKPADDMSPPKFSDDVAVAEPKDDVFATQPKNDVSTTESSDDVTVTEPTDDVFSTQPTDDVPPTIPTDDVLGKLLDMYMNGIKTNFEKEHHDLFEVLNVLLTDKDRLIREALDTLHPIQTKIIDDLKIEDKELNDLNNQIPTTIFEDLKKINENSLNLQNKLEEAIIYIQHII